MESTDTIQAPAADAQLVVVFTENQIDPESAHTLQAAFAPLFAEAEKWKRQTDGIQITSVEQVREMRLARETRLALREIRVNADKKRKAMKEASLRYSRAVDGAANVLKFLIEPLEERLLAQEQFADRIEEDRIAKLKTEREEALKPFGVDVTLYQLGMMPQEAFDQLLQGQQLAHQARLEASRKAENDRITAENARLAEEARIRDENTRLKKEADDRAEADRVAQEKAAADQKAAEERRAAVRQERLAILTPIEAVPAGIDLGNITEDHFLTLKEEGVARFERLAKERQKAEEERKEKLAAQARAEVARQRAAALTAQRTAILAPLDVDCTFLPLGTMTDEDFATLHANSKSAHEAGLERARADKARQIAEKAEKDRLDAIARAERQAQTDKAAKEKADLEAKAEADRKAKEKADAELQALRDAAAASAAALAETARKAAAAPDADKVRAIAAAVRAIPVPALDTPAGQITGPKIVAQFAKFAAWLDAQAVAIETPAP